MQYVEDENGVAIDGFRVKIYSAPVTSYFFSSGKSRGTQDMGCCWNRTLRRTVRKWNKNSPNWLSVPTAGNRNISLRKITLLGTILTGKATVKAEESDDDDMKWASPAINVGRHRGMGNHQKKKKKTADSESKQEPASILVSLTCFLYFLQLLMLAVPRGTCCAVSTNDSER